ncbi:MAG TPA: glycosyltransferase family 39 protein [Polyangiaceae bacterium]|nr:glycosyltransferase family 39 protein [Polyangiaceae bacterium]
MTNGPESSAPRRADAEHSMAPMNVNGIEAWFVRGGVRRAVLAGLLARVGLITLLLHWTAVPSTSDDATYVRFARAFLETGRIATHHFPIGYPILLAPFLTLGSFAFPAIRIAHVALGLLTIVIVSRIASDLYGERAGLFAAWFTALYPPLVFMTGRVMSETLFIALLVLSLRQFVLSDRDESTKRSVWAGAWLAVGSLARSNLVAMLPLIPLWYLCKRGSSWKGRLTRACACVAIASAILILPGLYFLATTGKFLPLATNAGQTFYGANNPLADGGWVEVNDHPELLRSIPDEVRRSPAAFSKAQQQLGVTWIKEHPTDFLRLLPKKFGNAWVPGFQTSEATSRSKLAAVILPLSLGLLLLGAIAGRLLVKPACRDGILLAVLATYTVMSLAFYGNPRIGLFCAPILIIYSGAAASWLLARRHAKGP